MRRIPILCGLAGLAALISMSGCAADGQKQDPARASAVPVVVVEVQPADVPIYADFAAQTYARDMVEVRGRVEGYIERWLFRPGAEVEAGQVLYVLDLRPYEASVQQARANLKQSEADLEFAERQVSLLQAQANLASAQANLVKAQQDNERLKPLVEAGAASQQDLDAAVAALRANEANVNAYKANVDQVTLSTRTQIDSMQAKVESQKAAVRTAELNLEYGTIRAPIGGRIGDTLVPVGGLVTPTSPQPLTTIVPLDPIWVRFKVTESEYAQVDQERPEPAGRRSSAHADPGRQFRVPLQGPHRELAQPGGPENRHARDCRRASRIRGTARFRASSAACACRSRSGSGALLVPQKAVQQLQSMQTVYVVGRDNKVSVRPVTTGARVGGNWVIEQGLKPGDRVIVEGPVAGAAGRRWSRPRTAERAGTEPWRASSSTIPFSRW